MSLDPAPELPIVLAVIIGAHGVTGDLRLKLFSDGPESLKRYKTVEAGGQTYTVKSVRAGPKGAIVRFAEVTDRNGAEALRGTEITVPRSALPPLEPGEYYHVDLLGLPCVTETGDPVGTVVAVENFGAGDILDIEKPDGKRVMIPMRPEAVPDWNTQRVVIDAAYNI